MEPTVSPVMTETEMNDVFTRLARTFSNLYQTSQNFSNLQAEVERLTQKVQEAVDQNRSLERDLAEVWQMVKTTEQERDDARREVQEKNNTIQQQAERILQQNQEIDSLHHEANGQASKVAELERNVQGLTHDRDYWQQLAGNREEELGRAWAQAKSNQSTADEYGFQRDAAKSEAENWKTKYEKVQSKFRSIFED